MGQAFMHGGQQALAHIARQSPLLAFDFDGTLAPIVATPDAANIPTAITECLIALHACAPVAIVTGRSIADVSARLGFQPDYLIGQHGAEIAGRLHVQGPSTRALDDFRRQLQSRQNVLHELGVNIEDKQLSIALHYRNASDHIRALHCIDSMLHELPEGLTHFGGKCVINVVAADSPDKGAALLTIQRHSERNSLVFIGDDENDEPAFHAGLMREDWLTIRVGDDRNDSSAKYLLASQAEILPMMNVLLDHMRTTRTTV